MKKLKKHWPILLIVLLIVGWFYWFHLRPVLTRRHCYRISKDMRPKGFGSVLAGSGDSREIDQNNDYRACLAEHGLKPESLFENLNE